MDPFEFFNRHCGRSGLFFFVGMFLLGFTVLAFAFASDTLDYIFSSPYVQTLRIGLAEFGLLIAALLVRRAILAFGRRRKHQSDRRPLSQNELRAARSKLLGNRMSRKL